ncbi:conjugal transfer protein TraG N-terminal domain-containing protein [Shewanella frigidimarina]|uniref:conjugal transfer protein TraG N-terminal domain-containing protein n=1 Tax=Shewanella frigidimarina TaxID=56812 RepID=UPI003D7B4C53
MTGFEVYSMGNPEFLIEIFKGLSRMWSQNDIYVLFGIALILGLMAGMFKWAIDQDKSPFPAKSFIISIVVVLGLLGPNSLVDVTVISKRDNSYQNISNVPFLPALSGWLITGTITVIADQFAQAFSVVGVANTWTAFSPIQHFVGLATADFQPACVPIAGSEKTYNICKTLSQYLNDCYITSELISSNKNDPLEKLANAKPKELVGLIKTTNLALETKYYLSTNPTFTDGIMASCIEAHTQLTTAVNSAHFNLALDKSSISQGLKLSEVDKFIAQQVPNGTIPEAESSLDLAKVMFLKSKFADNFNNSDYGNQVAKGMFDTVNQRHFVNAQKKEYWMENAEIMQSFFEALCVFITPFIGVTLAFSGQGLLAVGQYFMVWVFVNMWAVMLVLVNGFMAMAMTGRFTEGVAAGTSQFSLNSIDSQFTTANSYISMGGMLYTFIPAICIFVMYKGVHAMQGLASKSMQDPNIKAERFAPDTGATVNNGKTDYGNQNSVYQNNTGSHNRGDSLTQTSSGQFSVGSSSASSAGMAAQQLQSKADSVAASRSKAVEEMFSSGNVGSYDYKNGESNQYTIGSKEGAVEAAAQAIKEATGMDISQARKVAASGTVSGEVGGALSFGNGVAGMKLGGKAQAALGIDDSASESEKQSFQKSMDLAQRHFKEINASLQNTRMASTGWSDSTSSAFQEKASEGALLARQEQALRQQSASISDMQSRSSQLSDSTQIGMSQLQSALGNQSIQEFLQSSNPALWEQLQNQQYQLGNNTTGNAQEFLDKKTADYLASSNNTSVDGYAMAKSNALKDLIKEHDGIDYNKGGGVDFDKEKSDNQINQGIFQAMKEQGITGAAEAFNLYQQRGDQLDSMQQSSDRIGGNFDDAIKTINHPSSTELQAQSTNIQDQSNAVREDAANNTKGSMADVANNGSNMSADVASDAKEMGIAIPTGPGSNVAAKVDEAKDKVIEGNANAQHAFGLVSGIASKAAEGLKPEAEIAFNDMVSKLDPKNESDFNTLNSLSPEMSKAFGALNNYELGDINTDRIQKDMPREGNAELVGMLQNDQMKGLFLDENNEATQMARQTFDRDTVEKLEKFGQWESSYENNPTDHRTAISEGVKNSPINTTDNSPANAVLNAMEGTSTLNGFAGNNQFNDSTENTKALDLVRALVNGGESSELVQGDKGQGQFYSTAGSHMTYGGLSTGGNTADYNNELVNDVQSIASRIMPLLPESEQEKLQSKLDTIYDAKPSESLGVDHFVNSDKDNSIMARQAGLGAQQNPNTDVSSAFKSLLKGNMDDAYSNTNSWEASNQHNDALRNIDTPEKLNAISEMYDAAKPYISESTQSRMEEGINQVAKSLNLLPESEGEQNDRPLSASNFGNVGGR